MLWTTTPTGRKWPLLTPNPEDVCIEDIAQNLSLQVRFNGSLGAYSVAEHSVHCHDEAVTRGLPDDWCLMILLHDAHEAYIGDITTPVVNALSVMMEEMNYVNQGSTANKALEALKARNNRAIYKALGVPLTLPGEAYHQMREIDAAAMMTERDALAPDQPEPWGSYEMIRRLSFVPECWDAAKAKRRFLRRLNMQLARLANAAIA